MNAGNGRYGKPNVETTTVGFAAPRLVNKRVAGARGENASRRSGPAPAHDPKHPHIAQTPHLPHAADHDPIVEYAHCQTCHAALRMAFVIVADMSPSDRDVDHLIGVLRRVAAGNLRLVGETA